MSSSSATLVELKAFRLDVKKIDAAGTFSGYAAVFGNRDSYGDVIEAGAFAKTISDRRGMVPILWGHDPDEQMGFSSRLEEDAKGLFVEGEIERDTLRGPGAIALMRQAVRKGAPFGLSIGYEAVLKRAEAGVRYLSEIKLWEFSSTPFPVNELALVTGVKSGRFSAALARWAKQDPDGFRAALTALLTAEPPDGTPRKGAADLLPEPALATPGAFADHVLGGSR